MTTENDVREITVGYRGGRITRIPKGVSVEIGGRTLAVGDTFAAGVLTVRGEGDGPRLAWVEYE